MLKLVLGYLGKKGVFLIFNGGRRLRKVGEWE